MKNKIKANLIMISLLTACGFLGHVAYVNAQNNPQPPIPSPIPNPPIVQAFPPVANPTPAPGQAPAQVPAPISSAPGATPTPVPNLMPTNPALPPNNSNIPIASPANMPPLVSPVDSNTSPPPATNNQSRSNIELSVTPILKDLAVVKAQLQLVNARKELKKAEDELYGRNKEVKEEKLDKKDPPKEGPVVITAAMQKAQIEAMKLQQQSIAASFQPAVPEEPLMKVYSVTGFKGQLTAKVQLSRTKSSQVIKVGDELPNDSLVKEITQNYVVVRTGKGKETRNDRYYVEGGDPAMTASGTPGGAPTGPNPNARPSIPVAINPAGGGATQPPRPGMPNTANQSSATNIPPNTNPMLTTIPRK